MRLYLSSYRMGERFNELVETVGHGAKVAVVANALDLIPVEARQDYARNVFDPVAHFRSHGLSAIELDLRNFFGQSEKLSRLLSDVQVVWANGGNTFLLRRAMRQSGLDAILCRRTKQNNLIYGGWSAGAVVAGPTLRGIELMDDPQAIVEGYDDQPVWEGLGLVNFSIVPHFQSDHPESAAASKAAEWMTENGFPFCTLRDGEVLIL